MTSPRMSIVRGTCGDARDDWQSIAAAQSDGAAIVHVSSRGDDLPRIAALTWAIAAAGVFDQLVLDVARETGAERALDELSAAAAVRRLDTSSGLLAALQDALAGMRCVAVVVQADDDAALAGALASARLGISVVRVGRAAGDHGSARAIARLADLQLVFGDDDARALRTRFAPERIHVVGNPVVDAVRRFAGEASARAAWRPLQLEPGRYVLATAPVGGLTRLAARHRLVVEAPASWDPSAALEAGARVVRAPGYVDHLSLLRSAGAVVTDCARVREEAAVFGIECRASGDDVETPFAGERVIPLCDGRAGARAARVLVTNFARVRLA